MANQPLRLRREQLLANARLVNLGAGRWGAGSWLRIDDGGRIAATGPGETPTGDALVEDLGGAFVLPGLWNADMHLSWEGPAPAGETVAQRTSRCLENAVATLRRGFTGLRSAGEADYIDCALAEVFERGAVVGPRVAPAGYFLSSSAGHIVDDPVRLGLDGPEAMRKAVRENIRHGAQAIKLNLTGGLWGAPWNDLHRPTMSDVEITAAFETATQRGLPVMAFAASARAATIAARNGARSVEHGYALDEEAIEAMAAAGTFYIPTLGLSQLGARQAYDEYERAYLEWYNPPEGVTRNALAVAESVAWGFDAARKAGVRIASGSCMNPIAETGLLEIGYMVRFGMTPREALIAATRTAAQLTGCDAVTGTIEPGKAADLLAVGADPLADVRALREVRGVWRQGQRAV